MRLLVFASLLFAFGTTSFAQTQPYTYSLDSDSYTPLSGATSVNNDTTWDDPEFALPIGFSFTYFGTPMDTLYMIEDVWDIVLFFDDVADTMPALVPFGVDLIDRASDTFNFDGEPGSLSPISYKTEGTAGSRIFKLEFRNAGFYGQLNATNSATDSISFQVWLHESNQIIEYRFGPGNVDSTILSFITQTGPHIALSPLFEADNYFGIFSVNQADALMLSGMAGAATASWGQSTIFLDGLPPNGTVYRFTPTISSASDLAQGDLRFAPNPASNVLQLQSDEQLMPETLAMQNMAGQALPVQWDGGSLNISHLPSGLYLMRVQTMQGTWQSGRFIKR